MKGLILISEQQELGPKLSEIKLHSNIVSYDLELKLNQARKALLEGGQVRIMLQLNKEEKYRPQSAVIFLLNLIDKLEKYGTPQATPTIENLMVTLDPKK